jgi:S1-C subfamily serine protease
MAAAGLAQEVDPEPIMVGSFGISGLSFKGSYHRGSESTIGAYSFEAEPRIRSIDPDGPARGVLRAGDVIVAIDEYLITTAEGGRRFSEPPAGEKVRLTIRRHGRELEVTVVPVAVPVEDSIAAPGVPAPPAVPAPGMSIAVPAPVAAPAPSVPVELPRPARIAPDGWLGLGLSCARCTLNLPEDGGRMEWRFEGSTEVYSVDPGSPAHSAGLRRGDLLTHIDGVRLDSPEGSKRFSSLEPGLEVSWTVVRDGAAREVKMVAVKRPVPSAPQPPRPEPHLRWAG